MCLELKFSIADYEKWKQNFEGQAENRKKYGSKGAIAFTDVEDSSKVTVIVKGMTRESMAKAQASGDFREAMKGAGITDGPQMRYLEYVTELDS